MKISNNFIKLTLYLILILLPLGQLTRLPIAGGDVAVYLNDLLLPTLLFFWVSYSLVIRKKINFPPLTGWIFLFVAIAVISLVNGVRYVGYGNALVGGLYLWRFIMYAGVYFVMHDLNFIFGESFTASIIKLLLFGQGIFAALGILQFVLFPDFSKYVAHGWDPHYYRVLSTFFDPNFAGIYLVLGLTLLLSLIILHSPTRTIPNIAVTVLIIVAIMLTFSRSSYLAFITAVGFLGLLRSRRLLLVMMFLALLVFLFIPKVQRRVVEGINLDQTARARLVDWSKTFTIIKDRPVLGVGFNTLRYVKEQYGFFRDARGVEQESGHSGAGSDSSLLFVWATTGVLGLLAYLGLILGVWRQGWRNYRKTQGLTKVVGLSLAVSIPALLIDSWFVNSLFYPWVMLWLWAITGMSKSK